jgi:hypothetical protein
MFAAIRRAAARQAAAGETTRARPIPRLPLNNMIGLRSYT